MVAFDFVVQEDHRNIPYEDLFAHCINDAERMAFLFLIRLIDGQDGDKWFAEHPEAYENADQILFLTEEMDRLHSLIGNWATYIRFWMRSRIRVCVKRLVRMKEQADVCSLPGYGIF